MLRMIFRSVAHCLAVVVLFASTSAWAQGKLYLRAQTYAGLLNGEFLTVTDANGAFSVSGPAGGSRLTVQGGGYQLQFAIPDGQALAVGEYEATEIFNSEITSRTSMYVTTNYGQHYCSRVTGRFNILELTRDALGAVTTLALNFQQHCNGSAPAVLGQLRFNSLIATDELRRLPDYMVFQPQINQTPGATVVSNPVTVAGLDVAIPLVVMGGEYSINNGTYTSAVGAVKNGDTIRVRLVAPAGLGQRATAHLHFNGYRTSFAVGTTPPASPQPSYPTVVLYGQPMYNYSSPMTTLLSPATMQTLRMGKTSQNGINGLRVESLDEMSTYGVFDMAFFTAGGGAVTAGEYLNPASAAVAGRSALTISGSGYSSLLGSTVYCGSYSIAPLKVVVHEIEYASDGLPSKLAMDFIANCNSSNFGRIFGYLRLNSTRAIDYTITLPAPFEFPGVSDAQLSTPYISASRTVSGITVPIPISISGGEYSIGGGAFTTVPGVVSVGQQVRVRVVSAATANTLRTATLDLGGISFPFNVGTAVTSLPQPTTDPLMVQINVPRADADQLVTRVFSPATLSLFTLQSYYAIDKQFEVRIRKPGSYSDDVSLRFGGLNGQRLQPGTYTDIADYSDSSRVMINQQISSQCYAGLPFGKMVVHEIEYDAAGAPTKAAIDFRINCSAYSSLSEQYHYLRFNSTVPVDYSIDLPAPFTFAPAMGAVPGSTVTSNTITLRATNVDVPISILDGEYSIGNSAFSSAPGMIAPGQQVRVRALAPLAANTVRTVTLTIGGRSANFLIATDPGALPQPTGTPLVAIRAQSYTGTATQYVYSTGTLFDVGLRTGSDYYSRSGVEIKRMVPNSDGSVPSTYLHASGPNGAVLEAGTYLNAIDSSGSVQPYLSPFQSLSPQISPNPGQGSAPPYCGSQGWVLPMNTRFIVREIETAIGGQTLRLALDVVRTCGIYDLANIGGPAAIFTFVRINSTVPIDYELRQPVPFLLSAVSGVAPGAVVESAAFTVKGITVAVPISVAGGEYSVDGGAYTAVDGTVSAGQVVKVRVTASPLANDLRTATITVGEYTTALRVGTASGTNPPTNGAPLMLFISQGNELTGQGRTDVVSPATFRTIVATRDWTQSNVNITATPLVGTSGANWQLHFFAPSGTTVAPGTYTEVGPDNYPQSGRLNMRVWSNSTTCYPNGSLYAAGTSVTVHEIEYAGTNWSDPPTKVAIDFVIYCNAGSDPLYGYIRINSSVPVVPIVDSNPAPFGFAAVNSATRNAAIVSAAVTLNGFSVALPVSVVGGEYSIDGAAFTAMPGIVSPGQSLRARVIAASTFGGVAKAVVTVGSRSGEFAVTSEYQDSYPDIPVFPRVTAAPRATWIVSAPQVLTGFNTPASITPQQGEYSINGGPFTATSGMVAPGDSLRLRVMTGSSYGTTYTAFAYLDGWYGATFQAETVQQAVVQVTITGNGSVRFDPSGVNCSSSCGQLYEQGQQITLTATPAAGLGFAGWSGGACSGTGQCAITLDLTAQITATFAALPPAAPTLTQAAPGNARATLAFSPPASNGGSAITAYTATCLPGNATASGASSPLVVTGLTNGTLYQCSVTAANVNGTGVASNALPVTPGDALPIALVNVQSRKTHGGAGAFDLLIDASQAIGGPVTVEPRSIGAGHAIVFQMSDAVTAIGSVSVVDAADVAAGSATASFSGNEVIVMLTGVADNRRVKVQVNDVNGSTMVMASIGFLVGDINSSRSVNASDIAGVKARSGQTADATNFKFDLNASGGINATDISAAKPRSGLVIP